MWLLNLPSFWEHNYVHFCKPNMCPHAQGPQSSLQTPCKLALLLPHCKFLFTSTGKGPEMAFLHSAGLLQQSCRLVARWHCQQVRWNASGWQVSSHGRVKSPAGWINWGSRKCSGYYRKNVEGTCYYVHRLVAAAFLGPPPSDNHWQVHHIDADSSNNRVTNLQYVTPSENTRHSWTTTSERPSLAGKAGKRILWRARGDWSPCSSQAEAAKNLGVCKGCIYRSCLGMVTFCRGESGWYEFKSAHGTEPAPLAGEIWQTASYPGMDTEILNLKVSSFGRVLSVSSNRSSVTYGSRNANGYHVIVKGARHFCVHRLVAATFLGQPPSQNLQVNHKDRDRGNNHMDNLEYMTPSQNSKHAYSHGASKDRPGKAVEARLQGPGSPWLLFSSIRDAAVHTRISRNTISNLCKGHAVGVASREWEFRFEQQELLPGEEWRPMVFEGARAPKQGDEVACNNTGG